ENGLRPAPHTLGSAGDALTHTLETGPDVVHGRTAILHHRLTSDGGAPAPRRPAARTTTITDSPRGARRRASAAAARLALRERGERDQPAAIAATVRVEELRVTGGAQTRVLHARRVDARPPEQRLVGGPEVQHYPPGAPGSGPRFPAVRVGPGELARHRLVDLVAARADRGRDGRVESFGVGTERPERGDGGLGGAAHRAAPADVRCPERGHLRVIEDDREAVGREDRERRTRLDG